MSNRIAAVTLLVLSCGCSPRSSGQQSVVLPVHQHGTTVWTTEPWTPTAAELAELESRITDVSKLKPDEPRDTRSITSPEKYFRQYLPYMHAGKKWVSINAFCRVPTYTDWHQTYVSVVDGGDCYWKALYDPVTHQFSNLRINGLGG